MNRVARGIVAVAALVYLGSVGLIVYNTIETASTTDRVTRLEQSPCTEASASGKRFAATTAGRTCNRVRRDIAKRESLRNQCIIFERVTGRTPPRCRPGGRDYTDPHNAPTHNGPLTSSATPQQGGGISSAPAPSSQTTPPSGGDGGNGGPGDVTVVTPPTTTPAPEPDTSILNVDPQADCQVNALGVRVCLP